MSGMVDLWHIVGSLGLGSRKTGPTSAIGAMFSNLRYLLQEASGGDLISHVGRCFVMFLMPWMPLML